MTSADSHGPSYVSIWILLIALLFAGLAPSHFPISRTMAIVLIFGVATVKAFLITRHYMHLKNEGYLILAIAAIPLFLLIFLMISLVPDIVVNG